MTQPGYADVQPVPDAPLHASTGVVAPVTDLADLAAAEDVDYVVTGDDDIVADEDSPTPVADAWSEPSSGSEADTPATDSWTEPAAEPTETPADSSTTTESTTVAGS